MKKVMWLVVSFLMALSLVMAACGPAAAPTAPTKPAAPAAPAAPITPAAPAQEKQQKVAEAKEMVRDSLGRLVEKPRYGGIHNYVTGEPLYFDEFYSPLPAGVGAGGPLYFTHSRLLTGDRKKGPAGTGETDWKRGIVGQVGLFTGDLAESYELKPPDTIIWHIRKGIKWQNKPPVNGREFTAQDVAYSLNRHFLESTLSTMATRYKGVGNPPKSIKALDKYTVEVVVPPHLLGTIVIMMGNFTQIVAREPIDRYGDMKDWRNLVGTGPWFLKDYIPGSLLTYVRNPDYFTRDPLHPENQLPYLDTVKGFIIPDKSTQQAALRTGKIDLLSGLSWEDRDLFLKQRPELQFSGLLGVSNQLVGRQDKPELPFKDIRVRQALNLAINKQEILDKYFGGNGVIFAYPVPPTPSHAKLFTPLEEMPKEPTVPGSRASVPELFTYNPEKARQLLKEAGYPNGFKTQVAITSDQVDFLAIVKDQLSKVGVDLELKVYETAVRTNLYRTRTFPEMLTIGALDYSFPQTMLTVTATYDNPAFFNHDRSHTIVNETYEIVSANIGINDAVWQAALKKLYPYVLEHANVVYLPANYTYRMWWPWVKNYHGEERMGYDETVRYIDYIWVDQDLKKSMGY